MRRQVHIDGLDKCRITARLLHFKKRLPDVLLVAHFVQTPPDSDRLEPEMDATIVVNMRRTASVRRMRGLVHHVRKSLEEVIVAIETLSRERVLLQRLPLPVLASVVEQQIKLLFQSL